MSSGWDCLLTLAGGVKSRRSRAESSQVSDSEGAEETTAEGLPLSWIRPLASRVIWGLAVPALKEIASYDPPVATSVSREVADRLVAMAVRREGVGPGVHVWPTAQHGVRQLAELPGAQSDDLAKAFFEACVREPLFGPPYGLEKATLRWLLDEVPEEIERVVDFEGDMLLEDDPSAGFSHERFIKAALFHLSGEEGGRWMLRQIRSDDIGVSSSYQDMRVEREAPPWTPDTWVHRLNALAEAKLEPRPGLLRVFGIGGKPPPIESAAAQVRVALVYADDPTDYLLRSVGKALAGYSEGDAAADVDFFHWEADQRQIPLLRQLLEMCGPPGHRDQVVAAALEAGRVAPALAEQLAAPMDRQDWVDGPVPWAVAEVVDVGVARVPSGRVALADPYWAHEVLRWTVEVPPGEYPLRAVTASHPLQGNGNAALELVVSPDAEVSEWRLIESADPHSDGVVPENVVALADGDLMVDVPFEVVDPVENSPMDAAFERGARHFELDAGARGNLWVFLPGVQHATCLSWTAHDAAGTVVRIVSDLGLLELDLTHDELPW